MSREETAKYADLREDGSATVSSFEIDVKSRLVLDGLRSDGHIVATIVTHGFRPALTPTCAPPCHGNVTLASV